MRPRFESGRSRGNGVCSAPTIRKAYERGNLMFHFVSLKRGHARGGALLAVLMSASAAVAAAPVLGPQLNAQPASASGAVRDFTAPGSGWTMINCNATEYVDP